MPALVSWGAINKYNTPGGLEWGECIVSQSWRLKVQKQRAGRALVSLTALSEHSALPLAAWGFAGCPWLVAALLLCQGHLLSVCFQVHLPSVCVHLCVQISPSHKLDWSPSY